MCKTKLHTWKFHWRKLLYAFLCRGSLICISMPKIGQKVPQLTRSHGRVKRWSRIFACATSKAHDTIINLDLLLPMGPCRTIELRKPTSMVVSTPRLKCQCQKFGNLRWSFDFCHCHCRKLPQNKQKSQVLLLSGQNVVFSRIYVLTACDVAMDIIASKRKRSSRPSM